MTDELQPSNTPLGARLNEAELQRAVLAEAIHRGFKEPADAIAFVDRDRLIVDKEGTPRNVLELMDALVESKPYLVGDRQEYLAEIARRNPPPDPRLERARREAEWLGDGVIR